MSSLSYVTYTADGVSSVFSIPFNYLNKEYVFFFVNEEEVAQEDISWLSGTTVQLPYIPPAGSKIFIRRETEHDDLIITYKDGSTLTAEDLNTNNTQLLHVVQENIDEFSRASGEYITKMEDLLQQTTEQNETAAEQAEQFLEQAVQTINDAGAIQTAAAAAEADRAEAAAAEAEAAAAEAEEIIRPTAATTEKLGLVQIGDGILVDEAGVISADIPSLATTETPGIVQVGANLSITEDGVLSADAQEIEVGPDMMKDGTVISDKREVLYYESMPEGGLPTTGVKEGAIAFIDDTSSHVSEKIFYGSAWRDLDREAYARLPIATVISSMSNVTPHGFLHMNGDTFSVAAFPVLAKALGAPEGATTFTLPNGLGRVLWGDNTPGKYIEAGLPNISGWLSSVTARNWFGYGGALYYDSPTNYSYSNFANAGDGRIGGLNFNASRSNNIYGKSSTVQPPALTVKYYIKAYDVAITESQLQVSELINDIERKTRMPSDRYIQYAIPATMTEIAAPADGYFHFRSMLSSTNGYVALLRIKGGDIDLCVDGSGYSGFTPEILLPCKKADIVRVQYGNITINTFSALRFFYAEGVS